MFQEKKIFNSTCKVLLLSFIIIIFQNLFFSLCVKQNTFKQAYSYSQSNFKINEDLLFLFEEDDDLDLDLIINLFFQIVISVLFVLLIKNIHRYLFEKYCNKLYLKFLCLRN